MSATDFVPQASPQLPDDPIARRFKEFFSEPRDYAVLLKGAWGIGKTFYCENVIAPIAKKETSKEAVFVSLFGVSSIPDFDRRLVEGISPFLKSQSGSVAVKFGIGLSKKYLGYDPDYSDFVSAVKGRVVFIDDLERCDLGVKEIFGYVDNLITRHHIHAVLIGNEGEFSRGEEEYKLWKEKLIGFTYEYVPDYAVVSSQLIDASLKKHETLSWSRELMSAEYNDVILSHAPQESPNFRTLKVAIDIWSVVGESVPRPASDIDAAYKWLLRAVLGIVNETRKNEGAWRHISKAFSAGFDIATYQFQTAFAKEAERTEADADPADVESDPLIQFIGRYLGDAPNEVFGLREITSLIQSGKFQKDRFVVQFGELLASAKGPPPLGPVERLQNHLWTMGDDEVRDAAKEILSAITSHQLKSLRQLTQAVDILAFLAEKRLIAQSVEEIVRMGTESLAWLEANGQADPSGYSFDVLHLNSASAATREFQSAVVEAASRTAEQGRLAAWRALFEDFDNPEHSFAPITSEGMFRSTPLFSVLPTELVIGAVKKMNRAKLLELARAIGGRYNYQNVKDFVLAERPNLQVIGQALTAQAQAAGTPRTTRDLAMEEVAKAFNGIAARLA